MDGIFGGAATPFRAIAAAHLGSLAEHAEGCFWAGRRSALVAWGLEGASGVRALDVPGPSRAMSLSCHDRPLGCGLDLGCEVKPAS